MESQGGLRKKVKSFRHEIENTHIIHIIICAKYIDIGDQKQAQIDIFGDQKKAQIDIRRCPG